MKYLRTDTLPIGDLQPYPGNARVHDEAALDESAQVNGQYRSVVARVVDGGYQLLAGHGTVAAFGRQGEDAVRVEVIEADDTEARRIVLADNGTARNAGYDDRLLLDLIDEASRDGGLGGTGWDADAYKDLLDSAGSENPFDHDPGSTDPDDADVEPPADPITQPGGVWLLGRHRIICGDCRDPETVKRLLDGAQINVAFTSPPYASQRKYDESSGFKPIPPDEYVDWFEDVQARVREHLAADGSWFVNIKEHAEDGQRHLYVKDLTIAHVRSWSWRFVDELCWDTGGFPGLFGDRFKNGWEPVFHFASSRQRVKFNPWAVAHSSESAFTYDPNTEIHMDSNGYGQRDDPDRRAGMALPSNLVKVSSGGDGSHSAAFPVGLPAWFIRAYSDPGDCVFDPFMGSGTTLVASQRENRIAYGSEISPGYCDVIARRYQDLTGDKPVLERTGEPYDFTADPPCAAA